MERYTFEKATDEANKIKDKIIDGKANNYLEAESIIESENKDRILKKIGIEKREDGKLILYHATSANNLAKILDREEILPSSETGNKSWRVVGEDNVEKMSKIYLAKKNKIESIAEAIRTFSGGSMYILEVAVDEEDLLPDEDTGVDTWLESLAISSDSKSNFGGSCSHKGGIRNFTIHKKLPYELPRNRVIYYINKDTGNQSESLHKKFIAEIKENEEKEKLLLEDRISKFEIFNARNSN